MNEIKLKKIIANFDRKFSENERNRIKFADEPTRFASSETELFASLDELQSVATQPELYHVLIAKKTLTKLIALLSHENTDISAKVIGMLQEFTDIDEVDDQKSTEALIMALKQENAIDVIVLNLQRLDENNKDESQAINNSLAIMDNLIDFDAEFATNGSEPLIQWMIGQLKKCSKFNSIKLSISELLSVLLMNSVENRRFLGNSNGVDVLLQQVAYYMRVAPATGDEHEFLEQTINCLCTAILDCEENRYSFYKEEGVELVQLILREKRPAVKKSNIKISILKLFNHALTTDQNHNVVVTDCCEKFVKVLGLKVLFPIFNNPKIILSEKVKRREYHHVIDEIEEHTTAIVLALLKHCQNTEYIQRILIKFAEANFEKFDRLIDLHDKYLRIVSSQQDDTKESSDGRSSALFALRTIDYILLLIFYLVNKFEIYDPTSGETFVNCIKKLLDRRPELSGQILGEVEKHLEDVVDSKEEQNSLHLLVEYFVELDRGINKE